MKRTVFQSGVMISVLSIARSRPMVEAMGHRIPVMALTATATPKVQSDIVKNLSMVEPDSFHRFLQSSEFVL
jgi:superfamily II DNA helicase RecQ